MCGCVKATLYHVCTAAATAGLVHHSQRCHTTLVICQDVFTYKARHTVCHRVFLLQNKYRGLWVEDKDWGPRTSDTEQHTVKPYLTICIERPPACKDDMFQSPIPILPVCY